MCPVCTFDLAGHRFAQLATTVANQDNKQRVQELIEHVRQHEWSALAEYKEFRGDQDAVLVYAIMGSHEGGVVLLIRDPFELFEPHEVYVQEQTGAEEASEVAALATPDEWQNF